MSTFAAQIPFGLINGTNTTYTVTLNTNTLTGFEFYWNGLLQTPGLDYNFTQTLGTATLTTLRAPQSLDLLNTWLWQQ